MKTLLPLLTALTLTITTGISQAQSILFVNNNENPVSIYANISTGSVPYEGEVLNVDNESIAPGESVEIPLGQYWHVYLLGIDLVTGNSWDNDFNPGIHVPTGNLRLDWAGAVNGQGYTVTALTDPSLLEQARKLSIGIGYVNGSFVVE
jgi:hypothetical protein